MIARMEAMLAGGQDNALLRFGLGNAYLKTGNPAEAVPHLRAAVQHDPAYSAAWKLLGKALAEGGHPDEAAEAFEEGIRIAESNGDLQAVKEMGVFLNRLRKGRREH
jgi:Tfp pilus assembly protein PilF